MKTLAGFFARKAKKPQTTIIRLDEPHVVPVLPPEWLKAGDRLTLTFHSDALRVGSRIAKRVLVTGIAVSQIDER